MATADVWSDFFDASTHYTGPPLTDAMVASAERALGYALPASYLQLLRVKNGGCPKRQCHPTGGTHWSDNHVPHRHHLRHRRPVGDRFRGVRHAAPDRAGRAAGDRDRRRLDPGGRARRDHARLQCLRAAG